jgi:hypothetical protein
LWQSLIPFIGKAGRFSIGMSPQAPYQGSGVQVAPEPVQAIAAILEVGMFQTVGRCHHA